MRENKTYEALLKELEPKTDTEAYNKWVSEMPKQEKQIHLNWANDWVKQSQELYREFSEKAKIDDFYIEARDYWEIKHNQAIESLKYWEKVKY